MKFLLCAGSIKGGFYFVGPFDDPEAATAYAEGETEPGWNWEVCELNGPAESESAEP